MPSGLDAAEAVSLVLNYVTAYQMLHRSAKVRQGQRADPRRGRRRRLGLLQLGRLAGLEMYGTCSSRAASAVSDLGGIPIDYRRLDFVKEIHRLTGEGIDAVFDGIGGSHIWRSRKALPSWRDGSGLWSYILATWGAIGFRSSRSPSSLSWNRDLRLVHRRRLASSGSETGGALQHPVA